MPSYDAFLLVAFGGPEGMDDVMPFLENVLRGKNVPPERMRAVAAHYEHFGGVSPINGQSRALLEALRAEFEGHGLRLPLYWGNRNWAPMLTDTLRQMMEDGVTRAIAFVPSAFSSYSGCGQYLEDIARARARRPRPPAIPPGRRSHGRGARAHRLRLRPHGSEIRPRLRGAAPGRGAGLEPRPRRDRGDPSPVRLHDS